jgi:very-short-patch-repair endonuclease
MLLFWSNVLFLLAIGLVAVVVMRALRRLRQRRGFAPALGSPSLAQRRIANDYAVVTSLLTAAEQTYYAVLRAALPAEYTIMVQVALNRLVVVQRLPKTHHWRDPRWSRIAQKSLDYVVVRTADMVPVLVIELDDASHTQQMRIARDALVDDVLRDAGLPVIHQPVRATYDRMAIQAQLLVYLTP